MTVTEQIDQKHQEDLQRLTEVHRQRLMGRESENKVLGLIFFALKCKFFVNQIKKSFRKRLWRCRVSSFWT